MGTMSQAMHEQARDGLAEAIVELVAEEFCRGSDALGERGAEVLATAMNLFGQAFTDAARRMAAEGWFTPAPGTAPDPAEGDDFCRALDDEIEHIAAERPTKHRTAS